MYRPRAKDNEARSAEVARQGAAVLGLPVKLAQRAGELILATTHERVPDDPDARLVCDCDLAILGRPEAEFAIYEKAIRREYRWVPFPLYRRGRAAVLREFLDRPTIYGTARFREKYEAAARGSLMRVLGGGAGRA